MCRASEQEPEDNRTLGEVTEDGRGFGGKGGHTERGVGEKDGRLWAGVLHGGEFGEINGRNQRLNGGDRSGQRGA